MTMQDPPLLTTVANRPSPWLGYSDGIASAWVFGAIAILTIAWFLQVGNNRRVYITGWDTPIPETCAMVTRFGIDCPGCGLTRAFIHLIHGRPADAWALNPVGLAIFLFVLIQIPFGFAQVVLRKRRPWIELWGRWNERILCALLVALVLQWMIRQSIRMAL